MNELHDHDGLTDTCAAEHGGLSSLCQWSQQVDDLDPGLKYGGGGASVSEWRGRPMDGQTHHIAWKCWSVVADIADDVEEPTKNGLSDRYSDGSPGCMYWCPAFKSGGRLKRDTAHGTFVEMCLNLDDENPGPIPFDDKGFFKSWQFGAVEGDVDHRPAYGKDLSSRLRRLSHCDGHSCFRTSSLLQVPQCRPVGAVCSKWQSIGDA